MSGKSIPQTIEDLLNKIEKYLRDILSQEKLSRHAEKERKNFVEQIEVLKLQPPLPPLREEKNTPIAAKVTTRVENVEGEPNGSDSDCIYDDLSHSEDDAKEAALYEEPTRLRTNRETIEEDDSEYDNEEDDETDELRRDAIPLPTKKTLVFKKGDLPFSQLTDVLYTGELSLKTGSFFGTSKASRHFCALCNGRLIVYKSKDDARPVNKIQLTGCDVKYSEKEGSLTNVLKIAQVGAEKHSFAASSREDAGIWLQYLKSVCAGKGPPEKIDSDYLDSVDVTSDEGLGTSLQQSSSSDVTVPSSTEGSGDGVVTITGPQATSTPTAEKDKASKGSSVLGKLSTKLSTIGKSKGAKAGLQLKEMDGKEVFDSDPDVKISGFAKVKCEELIGNKKWHSYFCVVKLQAVECYKKLDNASPDVFFALNGVNIEPAEIPKRELAIKLKQADKDFFIEPSSRNEHGRWLSVLVKECGCGSPQANFPPEDDGLVYDELDVNSSGKGKVPAHGGSPTNIPPPLPRNPPPRMTPPLSRAAQDMHRPYEGTVEEESDDDSEDEGTGYKNMQTNQHNLFDKEEYEVATVGNEIDAYTLDLDQKETYDDIEFEPNPEEDVQKSAPKKQVGELIGRIRENLHRESSYPKPKQESEKLETKSSEVIPCATGPTIAEDKELLDKTTNPLLSALRKTKNPKTGIQDAELDKVVNQISDVKQEIVQLKKQRLHIRSRKLEVRSPTRKEALQAELQEVDAKLEEKQKKLTELQVIAQEQSPKVTRNHSFSGSTKNSPNVSRNSSFSSGRGSPVDSPRGSFSTKQAARTTTSLTHKTQSYRPTATQANSSKLSSSKANSLPTITSKTTGDQKVVTNTVKTSTYSWKSERSGTSSSKVGAKQTPTSASGGKVSTRKEVKTKDETSPTRLRSQKVEETSVKVTKMSSLSIPKVKDRMKIFEEKTAESKS